MLQSSFGFIFYKKILVNYAFSTKLLNRLSKKKQNYWIDIGMEMTREINKMQMAYLKKERMQMVIILVSYKCALRLGDFYCNIYL